MQYSYLKTLSKGGKHALITLIGFAITATLISGYNQLSIWDLAVRYAQPVLSTVTVGAVLTMFLNWVKNSQ